MARYSWFGLIELIWQYCSGPERQYDKGKEISPSCFSHSHLFSLYMTVLTVNVHSVEREH